MVQEQFKQVLAALPRLTEAQLREVLDTIERLQPSASADVLPPPAAGDIVVSGRDMPARSAPTATDPVFGMMIDGLSNHDIALRLSLSEHAVKQRVSGILQRLGMRTRTQAIAHMRREQARGLLHHEAEADPAADVGPDAAAGVALTTDELGLTRRQGSVLLLMLDGQPNKLIAKQLGLSENTVKEYVSAILGRLDLRNRTELIARMKRVSVQPDGIADHVGWLSGKSCPASAMPPARVPVTHDELGLTRRQGTVLVLLLDGLSNKAIGSRLGVSENTVKEHVSVILSRLDVRSRAQVISRMKGRVLQVA